MIEEAYLPHQQLIGDVNILSNKVTNLRTIQILLSDVRIMEQSVMNLKQWLLNRLTSQPKLYAFLPEKSTKSYLSDWIYEIIKSDG